MWLSRNRVFKVCIESKNLYVYSFYRNPDLDDRNLYCILTSMAALQAEDDRASLLFVGDLNSHHQEWLGSKTTNRHGVAAFDFATVSGCDHLVVSPTHARGGTLDLLITDVLDHLQVPVVAPIGNSDHLSLSAVISMAQAIPRLRVSRKVFLKHAVNWNAVCGAIQDLPCHNIWSADYPIEVLNEHLLLLVGRFVPTKVIRVCNKDKPWFVDQCRHAFGLKIEAYLRWTRDCFPVNCEEFVSCHVRAKRQMPNLLISSGPLLIKSAVLFIVATACCRRW